MSVTRTFPELARSVLSAALAADPVDATYLGDHAGDDRLPDVSPEAAQARAAELERQLTALADAAARDADEAVDRDVLRTALRAELFDLREIRAAEWNPMLVNPGSGLHALVSRDFAPLPERVAALNGRLRAVPAYLAGGRRRLAGAGRDGMSAVHLETALDQLAGTVGLLDSELRAADPDALATARTALDDHRAWLRDRVAAATRDPRLGTELFTGKLALTLDTACEPAALLRQAQEDLDEVGEQISEVASRLGGGVADVLARLAVDAPSDATIRGLCREALTEATEFVRTADLVTVHDDPIEVVEMPEADRGVAVAYCRPPGPLEAAGVPTEFAVSPTPAGWSADQVASFYREYNRHMVHDLTVHEAMPGHALQLMHSNRFRGTTPVRAVWWSGSLVEGWAVYAEKLMADHGYRAAGGAGTGAGANAALRMQQLKMQLRMILNAILDIRFHCPELCGDLGRDEALRLMRERGFQEEGEALGKWRRVQLTATQLCTYYVGFSEVRDLMTDLRAARPGASERDLHDAVLGAGSPPARHLRTLLGLRPAA